MEDKLKLIGRKLRARRDDLGLTQKQIAERIKVHSLTIGRMEDGSHSTQLETLIACCQVLGLSLDELFSDVEISKAQPIQEIVREPSSSEILSTIKQALKIAENPLIQRILACSEEERRELSDSMDMIEYSRSKIGKTQQSSKLAKHRK